jgi:hypothetical protein
MCDQPAEKQVLLRIFGGVTLLLGFIEFIVDIVLYTDLTAPKLGAWWAALIILVTSGLAVISTSRGVVIAAMVLSVSLKSCDFLLLVFISFSIQIIAVIVGVVGCIVDGIANSLVSSLVACISSNGQVSGTSSYASELEYGCGFPPSGECYCVQPGDSFCYIYQGGIAASSCGNILEKYTSNLGASIAFDLLATFSVFALSILTCVSVCCPGYGQLPKDVVVGTVAPGVQQQQQPVIIVANAPPQQVQYQVGQPQVQYQQVNQPQVQYAQHAQPVPEQEAMMGKH